MTDVAPLTPAGGPAAVRSLAAAFADYPLLRAIAPFHRGPACAAFCGMLVRATIPVGTAFATADGTGVACWLPPEHPAVTPWGLLRSGVLRLAWELGPLGTMRLERIARQFEQLRKKHVPGPHWYLMLLGVDPSARRRGRARAVLQPGFAAADRARLPCYLETQDDADVPIYARFGFHVVGRRRLAGGLWNWEMTRLPM